MTTDYRLANYSIFYAVTLLFFAVGAITTLGLTWYTQLTLPMWAPPELLVATIWAALFLFAAFAVSLYWDSATKDRAFGRTILLFMGNAVLVLLWNYLFFGLHFLNASFWAACTVGISVLLLVVRVRKASGVAALLLLPYLAWMAFAICLMYSLMILNA